MNDRVYIWLGCKLELATRFNHWWAGVKSSLQDQMCTSFRWAIWGNLGLLLVSLSPVHVLWPFVSYILFQAFIFWVVDNFLKRRTKNTKTIYVSENDHSVKYSRNEDTARLYSRIERADDGDSDIILTDEDGDTRHRHMDGERLNSWHRAPAEVEVQVEHDDITADRPIVQV